MPDEQLITTTSAERLLLPGGGSYADQHLASAMLWTLEADLAHLPRKYRDDLEAGRLLLDAVAKPKGIDTGIEGNRHEVAFVNLVQRPEGSELRRHLKIAMTKCTSNGDVVEAASAPGDVKAVAIAREKSQPGRGSRSLLGDYTALCEATADTARVVVPVSRGPYFRLKPKTDPAGGPRLHTLLTAPLGQPIPGYAEPVAYLHHADVLVGDPAGQFWFGVDIKTARQGRPTRRAWAGIAIHVDILLRAPDRGADPITTEPTLYGHPSLVTLHASHTAFRYLADAQRVLEQLHVQPLSAHVPHGGPVDDLLRELLPLRYEPVQAALEVLWERSGQRVLIPTEAEISRYGDSSVAQRVAFGDLAA